MPLIEEPRPPQRARVGRSINRRLLAVVLGCLFSVLVVGATLVWYAYHLDPSAGPDARTPVWGTLGVLVLLTAVGLSVGAVRRAL